MSPPDQDSDSDWEYEYSTTETSTYYIPIDLSNIPDAQVPFTNTQRQGHPTLLKSRVRALNAQRAPGPMLPGPLATDPGTAAEQQQATGTPDSEHTLRVTGLHTPNPLLEYNGQLLSCQWAATLGTDFFFAAPDARDGVAPLRELPGDVDLLATSSAKLIARKATLRPADHVVEDFVPAEGPLGANGDDGDVLMQDAEEGAAVAQDAAQPSAAPSSFLARLNAAKVRRGDATQLTVSSSKTGKKVVAERINGGVGRG
jgi:hypothetical protein